MPDANYKALKDFVARSGGVRLAMHGQLRDQLVEMAVEEFPFDAPDERRVEVLAARLRIRARERYGSVVIMLLVSVLANLIAKLVIEWWKKHHSHKVLMYGWHKYAQASRNLPPAVDSEEA
jgi:hypothetical protein